ncbi:UNVERIFIED_CONTAM: hypothetical protein HDU68_012323 [Siphonaria sp. JEL0065]|nr:hypothetical protein HDU68_012323 [Siphonaria sp. JEL0065]
MTTPAKKSKGTVASLHPSLAIQVIESARIIQAAQLMAAKRMDCVLAVNEDGQLSGILTDKDVVYRVVANGLDTRTTTVAGAMTRDPVAVFENGPRNDALGVMVGRRFRHLPVISASSSNEAEEDSDSDGEDGTNVVGVLDITKCVFDKLDELGRKVDAVRGCPDLAAVLGKKGPVPLVAPTDAIASAAALMRDGHETGVLVVEDGPRGLVLLGILTTKDIVNKVVAAGLNANDTKVAQIMTPNPKSGPASTSILDALKMLHAGHYLHLPVCDGNTPIGLVDVLTLTMSMLDYMINTENKDQALSYNAAEPSGPLWNNFWNSTWSTVDSESNAGSEAFSDDHHSSFSQPQNRPISTSTFNTFHTANGQSTTSRPNSYMTAPSAFGGSQSQRPQSFPAQIRSPIPHQSEIPPQNNYPSNMNTSYNSYSNSLQSPLSAVMNQLPGVAPNNLPGYIPSYPNNGTASPTQSASVYDDPSRVGIKLSDPKRGKVVRFHVMTGTSLNDLKAIASGRLGIPLDQDGSLRLSYEDDDGDWVLLSGDADLEDAIGMARRLGEKLNVRVGEDVVLLNREVIVPSGSATSGSAFEAGGDAVSGGAKKDLGANDKKAASSAEEGGVLAFLKDAPLSVNVAISAGIVVVAAFALSKLYSPRYY